jgi:FSR family fosmidomycin resistance protein-like MFS transporter
MGYAIDRGESRTWLVATLLASAVLFSLLALAPTPAVAFGLLLLGGLSVSAFHPAAGSLVTRMAAAQWGRATSLFMAGGPLGSAIGPVAIAALFTVAGVEAAWLAAVPGLLLAGVVHVGLRRMAGRIVRQPPGPIGPALRRHARILLVLVCAVIFQASGIVGFVTFWPTVATDRGQSLVEAGFGLALFQAGGAVGALVGGSLSDRVDRRLVLLVAPLLGVPLLLLAMLAGSSPIHLPMLALAGALQMSAGPVQLVIIQELLPENRSLAAGLMFFLGVGAASLAGIAVGVLGDIIGLERALLIGTGAAVLSALFVPLLRPRRSAT